MTLSIERKHNILTHPQMAEGGTLDVSAAHALLQVLGTSGQGGSMRTVDVTSGDDVVPFHREFHHSDHTTDGAENNNKPVGGRKRTMCVYPGCVTKVYTQGRHARTLQEARW